MNAVEAKDLKKRYELWIGRGFCRVKKEVVAVEGIDLIVPQGQSVAFIGPNGAGKSTTIKILTGILRATSGHVRILGLDPWDERRKLAYRIGAVFGQRSQLWYHLPAADTFDLLCRIYNLDAADYQKRRDELIERFNLGSFLNIPVRKLSLGQRMRAELAASLLHRPQLLFLDEPTIGLDVIARQELRDLLTQWNRRDGLTLFLTSHDTGDIEEVAERVIVVNHGRIVLDDSVDGMRREHLRSKVVKVTFHEQVADLSAPGLDVLDRGPYSWKLEIDTRVLSVPEAISKLMSLGAVADLSVEDPPLEDVIAHIYATSPKPVEALEGNLKMEVSQS